MTSRVSFFKNKAADGRSAGVSFAGMAAGELKRRAWVIALCALNFVMWGPVVTLLEYESNKQYYDAESLLSAMERSFCGDIRNILSVGGVAVLLGLNCFWFLLSKKKTDLYHSLPVKRRELFGVMYVTGIAIFAVTWIFASVLLIIAAAANGFYTFGAFSYHATAMVMDLVYFLMMYNLTIIAVMLSGTSVVAVCFVGVLNFIYPIFTECFEWMGSIYFASKSSFGTIGRPVWNRIPYLSPMYTYAGFIGDMGSGAKGLGWMREESHVIAMSLLVAAVFFAAAYLLYMKRPSEAAGKAIAFKASEPIIRIPLVISAALVSACGVESILNIEYSPWIWVFLVFGGVLMHCVLEIIFNSDFKALFKHPVQMAGCVGAAALMLVCCWLDLFGYDTWLPNRQKVEAAAVYLQNPDCTQGPSTIEDADGDGFFEVSYRGGTYRMSEHMFSDDDMIDAVYALAEKGMEHVHDRPEGAEDASMPLPVEGGYLISTDQRTDDTIWVYVAWRLKNGRSVSRCYSISAGLVMEELDAVYSMKEYKQAAYDIYDAVELGAIGCFRVRDNAGESVMLLEKEDDVKAFTKAYMADLEASGIDTISGSPMGSLEYGVRTRAADQYQGVEWIYGYYIYPEYTNTLRFMEGMNVDISELTTAADTGVSHEGVPKM